MSSFDIPQETASLDDMHALMYCAARVDFRKLKTQLADAAMLCGDNELVRHSMRFWRRSLQSKPTIRKVYPLGVVTECDNELGILVHEFGLRAACIVEMHEPLTSAQYAEFPFVSEISAPRISCRVMQEMMDKVVTLANPSNHAVQFA